jgi:hypothetical protein
VPAIGQPHPPWIISYREFAYSEDPRCPTSKYRLPISQDNNIVLTEVVRPGPRTDHTVTVLIDGTAIAVSEPFLTLDEAVDQADEQAKHYGLDPIYFRREQA